jgi:hypothetical protein
VPDNGGEYEFGFENGEVGADAHSWPATEGEVSVAVARCFAVGLQRHLDGIPVVASESGECPEGVLV